MAQFDRPTISARAGSAAAIDEGLRSYMLRVYNYMGVGLVVTGLVAYFASAAAYIQGLTDLDAARYVLLNRTGRLAQELGIAPQEGEDAR